MINAGRIRMVYPENKAAADHFENLRSQFAEGVQRVRGNYIFVREEFDVLFLGKCFL